jgi:type II secretory pathway component PulC
MTYFFLRFLSVSIPHREPIQPRVQITKERIVHVNIKKIYEHDLFNTVKKEEPKMMVGENIPPLPAPPKIQIQKIPEPVAPTFLDPLSISLKGILVLGAHNPQNRAIIQDTKTNRELSMAIGDMIYDAQLIRILKNKVIFLRANGQQEILYLREQDAKLDASYGFANNWSDSIKPVQDALYRIDLTQFILRVANVGQLLYMLGVTTAYKEGKSIGCRIGVADEQSVGNALGLKVGDTVISIDEFPVSTVVDRMNAFKRISEKKSGEQIVLELLRRDRRLKITYQLVDAASAQVVNTSGENQKIVEAPNTINASVLRATQEHLAKKERDFLLSQRTASRKSGDV